VIVYFDTSAFLPLVVAESGSPIAVRLWEDAQQRASSRLLRVEAAAAVAMGKRMGRLTDDEHEAVQEDAWRYATNMTLIDPFGAVVDRAADLAASHGLRGHDAVHLATATSIRGRDLIFASGDQKLLAAAREEGFTTVDTSSPDLSGA